MDGSAKDFLKVIKKLDLVDQTKSRKFFKNINKIELVDGKRKMSIEPNETSFEVNFNLIIKIRLLESKKMLLIFNWII